MPNSYRIFIAYSHKDQTLVRGLIEVLDALKLDPMLDEQLTPGLEFSPGILDLITNCHIFLPLITPRSNARPWLNQEIGFALALGKPILPVVVGKAPPGLISVRQAITVQEDLSGAKTLIAEHIDRIVEHDRPRRVMYEAAEDNTQRAQMLAEYANSVLRLGKCGRVRQQASLTTFHFQIVGPTSPVWREYFSVHEQETLFEALLDERAALGEHAAREGCRLIIDPVEAVESVYARFGSSSSMSRVRGLLSFLSSESVADVVIGINNDPQRYNSITLVGDWFFSHAVTSRLSHSRGKGLKESLFTRHHRTIRQQTQDFDQHLNDLLSARGWTPENSRALAINYLREYLRRKGSA